MSRRYKIYIYMLAMSTHICMNDFFVIIIGFLFPELQLSIAKNSFLQVNAQYPSRPKR